MSRVDRQNAAGPVAIIAEDEPLLADELVEQLAVLWPQLRIAACVCDGAAALQAIEAHTPDIAFLDIQMPVLSGIDVARRVSDRCRVAFISAFDQHAIAAFDAGGVDYVLKPVSMVRLAATVERLKAQLGSSPAQLRHVLDQLVKGARGGRHYLQWISASRGSALQLLMVDDILYFKADSKYTSVVTADGELLIRKTIKELGEELDPTEFWQVHRSSIVNVHAIDRLLRDGRGNMTLCVKGRRETLVVSTPYQALFRQM
jgi:DNA-binding LytR/AlgR family response regulator